MSESRVMWATSVPILVFLSLSVLELCRMYVTDRRQTKASLNASTLSGRRHIYMEYTSGIPNAYFIGLRRCNVRTGPSFMFFDSFTLGRLLHLRSLSGGVSLTRRKCYWFPRQLTLQRRLRVNKSRALPLVNVFTLKIAFLSPPESQDPFPLEFLNPV